MKFELKLKEITEKELLLRNSPNYRIEITELLKNELQAKEISFFENYTKSLIVAPGLQRHYGSKGIFQSEFTTYLAKNGEGVLGYEDNGFAKLSFIFDNKIAIDFSNILKFPEKAIYNNVNGHYNFLTEKGRFWADTVEFGKGQYFLNENENLDIWLEVSISTNNRGVKWVRFKSECLGTGILTSFFNDFNYNGLDRLV